MDPDVALANIRQLVGEITDDAPGDVVELIQAIAGLDEWLSRGGFAPSAWRNAEPAQHENGGVA